MAGSSLSAAARQFGVTRQAIANWCRDAGVTPVLHDSARAREAIIEKLNEYIVAALEAMTAQMKLSSDDAWLRAYSPADLAQLHRTLTESIARVVEAQQAGTPGAVEEQPALGPGSP